MRKYYILEHSRSEKGKRTTIDVFTNRKKAIERMLFNKRYNGGWHHLVHVQALSERLL